MKMPSKSKDSAKKSTPPRLVPPLKRGLISVDKTKVKTSLKPLVKVAGPSSQFRLSADQLVKMHDEMVKARVLEERLIKMYKQSDGFFWIGGPGEEAFNVSVGLQIHKGQGPKHDFLHLHYRSLAILTTMGMEPLGALRQMKNVAADPHSGGRNFGNHFSIRKWNVAPISSTIETQYQTAIGTGIAQLREGGKGLTYVNGGDAGTAEGDFASCLVWSSRPGNELPIMMVVTNNEWGISTPANTQHGDKRIADRGKAFGIRTAWVNGNDVEEAYFMVKEAMDYVRTERKPFLLEAQVSRLYGHSSATGCNYVTEEVDCLPTFEKKLADASILSPAEAASVRERYNQEFLEMAQKVKQEPLPDASTLYDNVYWQQKGKYW